MKIHLSPVWRFSREGERELDATVLALLEAIEQSGKLTQAARAAGISHRHAWNLIAFRAAVTETHGERAHRTGKLSKLSETPPWNELI